MIILCQWDFKEEIEKLVRLLPVRNVQEKIMLVYLLYPVSKLRVNSGQYFLTFRTHLPLALQWSPLPPRCNFVVPSVYSSFIVQF